MLRAGRCTDAQCDSGSSVLAGLGVCLSDLVVVPKPVASGTSTAAPLPTVSGIDTPTAPSTSTDSGGRKLAWWEILLMALGCAFIFLAFLLCWRRRARKQRVQRTQLFATAKALDPKLSWRQRLFGRFFRAAPAAAATGPVRLAAEQDESEAIKLMRIRNAEEARHNIEMEKLQLYGSYEYSWKAASRAPSPLPSVRGDDSPRPRARELERETLSDRETLSRGSIYSQVTGLPRRTPEPRQPVRTGDLLGLEPLSSRFSDTTRGSSLRNAPSAAEAYASDVRQNRLLEPASTGGSLNSLNPFRRR